MAVSGWVGSLGLVVWVGCLGGTGGVVVGGLVALGRGRSGSGLGGDSGQGRQGLAQQGSKSTVMHTQDFSSHTHHSHRTPWSRVHASL